MTRPFDKLRTQQLVVECSDPGLVVSLTEEFEHVLRQVDFARARALHDQLSTLARELGPEFERAWRGFRLEMPNDGGSHPPAFGNRETADTADEEWLKGLLAQAEERNIGRFKVRSTLLLPQHGPLPETREQYVCDLADTVRGATWDELGIFQSPVPLPKAMAAHRERLMEQHGVPLLRARARFPTAGHVWTRDSLKALEGMLREVNTRAEAVRRGAHCLLLLGYKGRRSEFSPSTAELADGFSLLNLLGRRVDVLVAADDYTRRRLGLIETCGEGFVRFNLDGTSDRCCFPACEYRAVEGAGLVQRGGRRCSKS